MAFPPECIYCCKLVLCQCNIRETGLDIEAGIYIPCTLSFTVVDILPILHIDLMF